MTGSPPSNLTVEQILAWALLALHTNGSSQTVQEGEKFSPIFIRTRTERNYRSCESSAPARLAWSNGPLVDSCR